MADEITWVKTPQPIIVDLGNSKLVRVSRTKGIRKDGSEMHIIKMQEGFGKGSLSLSGDITDDKLKELFGAVRAVQKEVS